MSVILQVDGLHCHYVGTAGRGQVRTAIVWPFLNLERGQGVQELFLDTNALAKVRWLEDAPEDLRRNCVVNPWMAVQEQWFSNPRFREEPQARLNDWIASLAELGVEFRPRYATDQVRLLKSNEAALRKHFSSVIPFVAIMRTVLSEKQSTDEALARLTELGKADIPRFTGAIALTALAVALKKKQSLVLEGDSRPAYSYLESFLAFQKDKNETDYMRETESPALA